MGGNAHTVYGISDGRLQVSEKGWLLCVPSALSVAVVHPDLVQAPQFLKSHLKDLHLRMGTMLVTSRAQALPGARASTGLGAPQQPFSDRKWMTVWNTWINALTFSFGCSEESPESCCVSMHLQ